MSEAPLRKSYERILAYRAESGGDRTACPSLDELQALVSRQGPETERLQRLDHVMGCPFCREEFELLRTVRSAGTEPALSRRILALAASVMLVVGAGLVWRMNRPTGDIPRGSAAPVVLLTPADGATLSAMPTFAWRPVSDALHYRIELLQPDGTVVWQTVIADTTGSVPDSAAPVPGVEYRWLVEAETADGSVRRSEVQRFSVRRP
jgi:hypothetical protein